MCLQVLLLRSGLYISVLVVDDLNSGSFNQIMIGLNKLTSSIAVYKTYDNNVYIDKSLFCSAENVWNSVLSCLLATNKQIELIINTWWSHKWDSCIWNIRCVLLCGQNGKLACHCFYCFCLVVSGYFLHISIFV